MLKLKNVSKFYYNKGVIASGFSKINIEFEMNEFVVITGESGSGKSTLLNVISGLDSYEEGEMYINGKETSHYKESDFEEYRKKYVSNIFQNFNLVNSYTVYQNVELVLLINGYKKKEVKGKILDLIDKVGLTKYKNTMVSKLSGGQKQRVAIARALAKETPIIVCDEPTGNLDSKSSKEIIKILKEVSKDKLVIMVTHDFPSVEKIATRVVKMHDGKIISDKKMVDNNDKKMVEVDDSDKKIGLFNIIRLGVRNTFNIIPKFILMFIVFLFITTSLLSVYGTLRKSEYESSKLGTNYYFGDTTDTRIVIKKQDGSVITSEDIDKIKKIKNIDYIVENDIILDEYLWFDSSNNGEFYMGGYLRNVDTFNEELDYGRMPENDNEVVFLVNDYEYVFKERLEDAIKETYYQNGDREGMNVKVVGVKYIKNGMFNNSDNIIYGKKSLIDKYMTSVNISRSSIQVNINNKNYNSYNQAGDMFSIFPSDRVSKGNAIISEDINYTCKDFNCKGKTLGIKVDNLYFKDNVKMKINNVYNSKNVNSLLGINKDNSRYGSIFINKDDYDKLFNKGVYQSSVFAKRADYVTDIASELEELGYKTLEIRKSFNNDGQTVAQVIKIVKLVVIVGLVITLFFISYFVIKLILKSRNVYFSILRILGSTVHQTKRILDVELFVNSSLAYFTYIGFILLVKNGVINVKFISDVVEYLHIFDYILMYVILVLMSYLISSRFSRKIFKKSAMKSYREEV